MNTATVAMMMSLNISGGMTLQMTSPVQTTPHPTVSKNRLPP